MPPPYLVKNPECVIKIGTKTELKSNIVFGPRCRRVDIGFGCFLGRDLYIDVEELSIGDYTTIHHGSVLHGVKTTIGHNCWIGHYCILDSLGGLAQIGNNVGIGPHSQLWSHMQFGDTLAGCQWRSHGTIRLDDDVSLVGHSITGPIHAEQKALLMTGSVAFSNMRENNIYWGTPAKNVTQQMGPQFAAPPLKERTKGFSNLKSQYELETGRSSERFVAVEAFTGHPDRTEFLLMERQYKPRYTDDEYDFMKFLLYDKAKFTPAEQR